MVPEAGWWHSAFNSTLIHPCPNPLACNNDNVTRAALGACQAQLYANLSDAADSAGMGHGWVFPRAALVCRAPAELGGGLVPYAELQCAVGYTGTLW